jgi:hypothetical protein
LRDHEILDQWFRRNQSQAGQGEVVTGQCYWTVPVSLVPQAK